MSVDSRNKRMSMLNIGMPFCDNLIHPDGTIENTDRLLLVRLYAMVWPPAIVPYITSYGWLRSRTGDRLSHTREYKGFPLTFPIEWIPPNVLSESESDKLTEAETG